MTKKPLSTKNLKPQIKDDAEFDEFGLPLQKTKQVAKIDSLKIFWIAPPGWGKTVNSTAIEDTLLLACEEGHRFVNGYKIVIDSWGGKEDYIDDEGVLHLDMIEAVERIRKTDRFKHIVIDTIDEMLRMCVEYHTGRKKAEHISDLGDYGKGFEIGRDIPMQKILNQIIKSGRGVSYLTHQHTKVIKVGKGDNQREKTIKGSTLPDKVFTYVHKQCDAIFHGEFGKHRKGQVGRDRIVHTEGSEEMFAKNRGDLWPKRFILPQEPEEVQKLLREFLTNPESKEKAYQEYLKIYGE